MRGKKCEEKNKPVRAMLCQLPDAIAMTVVPAGAFIWGWTNLETLVRKNTEICEKIWNFYGISRVQSFFKLYLSSKLENYMAFFCTKKKMKKITLLEKETQDKKKKSGDPKLYVPLKASEWEFPASIDFNLCKSTSFGVPWEFPP